ncbi:DUF1735 domain-containing protein [Mucilaginibacter sp. UR6-1]|uniref:BT_3987 domain-containing protein n=1 Tax=Mucilaginibacter sp. UR6-1 TaxID=1435643 RepID=UPI001E60F139|nr:DUF1735 domain-containing protein [Mucilaginibacter sp. UR6-1]MCC8408569.1 DUF1735 domain-containing protein [Mucilaginibacter sp. UR6-1]
MRNKIKHCKNFGFLALLLVITASACKKNETYDITGDNVNRVYVTSASNLVKSTNSYNFTITNTVIGSVGSVNAAVPVRTTMPAAGALKVSFAVDNNLIDAYNTANNTNYVALPGDILNLNTASVNVPQGQQQSSDSLKIAIPNEKLSQLTENTYLLPVKIAAVTGDAATQVSTNKNVFYVVVTVRVSTSQLYESPTGADMTGDIIANRGSWSATIDKPLILGSPADLFDGNTGSFFYYTSANSTLVTDLSETVTGISGIRIKNYFGFYGITNAKVLISTNGTNWTDLGTATLGGGESQYIKPYKPFNARYIRLDITDWQNNLIALTEFDLYK